LYCGSAGENMLDWPENTGLALLIRPKNSQRDYETCNLRASRSRFPGLCEGAIRARRRRDRQRSQRRPGSSVSPAGGQRGPGCHDDVGLQADQLLRERSDPIDVTAGPPKVDHHVAAIGPTQVRKRLREGRTLKLLARNLGGEVRRGDLMRLPAAAGSRPGSRAWRSGVQGGPFSPGELSPARTLHFGL
jgi:hypothetical protein